MSPSDDKNGRRVREAARLMVVVALIFAALSFLVLWLTIVGR